MPSVQVYRAYKAGQLPLPSASNADGKRRFNNLFKTDATLIFEVSVNKIVNPTNTINDSEFTVPLGI